MRAGRWGGVVSVAIVAASLAWAAPAPASTIVYTCYPDLCSVRPDGTGKRRLTTDGDRLAYRTPSLARDGRRLLFNRGNRAYVADARVRNRRKLGIVAPGGVSLNPDGNGIVYGKPYPPSQGRGPLCRGTISPRRERCVTHTGYYLPRGWIAWGPGHSLISTDTDERVDVCVTNFFVEPPRCTRTLARTDPGETFYGPSALSPDGKLLAVALASGRYFQSTGLAVYDVRTQRLVRTFTGPSDEVDAPIWSPDGRWIAYRQVIPETNDSPTMASLRRVRVTGGKPRVILPRERSLLATWGG